MEAVHGSTAPGFDGVRDAFAANMAGGTEIGAAVAVYLNGRPVVDLWGGIADPATGRPWERDTFAVVYSTTKGVVAACAHLLAERGELDLDAPVATYWPEFAAAGKERLPVRWLLTHQAGLTALDHPVTPEQAIAWDPVVAALAAQRPHWQPGTDSGYHGLTYGFLVGEVVRRATGRTVGEVLRSEIAEPLGADFRIGLPAAELHRVAWMDTATPDFASLDGMDVSAFPEPMRDVMAAWADPASLTRRTMQTVTPPLDHNRPEELAAELPGTNGVGTARGPARIYASLIGEVDGHRILGAAALAAATAEEVSGVDRVLRMPVRIATGFGLPAPDTWWYGPAAFGFAGLGGSIAFADPDTGIAFAYVMNHVIEGVPDQRAANLWAAVSAAQPLL